MPATTNLSTAERIRRAEYLRDSRAVALTQGQTIETRTKQREELANNWSAWFRQRMDAADCNDPVEVLPDALSRLEQIIDDRIAVALNEFKSVMKGALK
jgi:hypothetical protein